MNDGIALCPHVDWSRCIAFLAWMDGCVARKCRHQGRDWVGVPGRATAIDYLFY
jgi:hypothetical protein